MDHEPFPKRVDSPRVVGTFRPSLACDALTPCPTLLYCSRSPHGNMRATRVDVTVPHFPTPSPDHYPIVVCSPDDVLTGVPPTMSSTMSPTSSTEPEATGSSGSWRAASPTNLVGVSIASCALVAAALAGRV